MWGEIEYTRPIPHPAFYFFWMFLMPTYEYHCQDCGHPFEELFLSLKRIPEQIPCPACGSANTRRLISAPAVRLARAASAEPAPASSAAGSRLQGPVFGRKELEQLPK